ncbi:T9SS type A sorting domain-containing protein [uncultured Microscilla sp.]|uniref:T9SS type A sorting domain-containing protein n=1 Tax=uncultured Microscilla sp. TaxID=432653 RepID=UPI0026042F3F|nr:T9SS type A sorting domain-containing protein [uncultured Microscilla sp.]
MRFFQKKLWLIVLLACSTSLWAQQLSKEEKRAKRKAYRTEARAYKQKNVLPVIKAQRIKLDAVMSVADRQKVDDLRAQKKAARKKMRAHRKEMRKLHKKGERPQLTETQKQEMKAMRKARRNAKFAAWQIVDKYETTVEKLIAEIKPQQEQWHKDLKAIRVKHFGERKPASHKTGEHKRHHKRKGHHGKRRHGMRKMLHPVRFLLFDPAATTKTKPGKNTTIYPNPLGTESKVEYTLIQTERVTIRLVDANGKFIKEVLNETKSAGTHAQKVDMRELKNGTYYLRIKTSAGTQTKRIIKR